MQITYVVGEERNTHIFYGMGITIPYRSIKYELMNENLSNGSVIKIDNVLYRIESIRIISAKVVKLWLTHHTNRRQEA